MTAVKPMVVDIYHGDIVQDFAKAKAFGIQGIIHKSSQGTAYADDEYARRRPQAIAAGLLWGAYHFLNNGNIEAQATYFLECANPDAHTLLAADFEDSGRRTPSLAQLREFLTIIDDKIGRPCVLYSGNLIKEMLGTRVDPFFAKRRLWLAQYGTKWKVPPSWETPWLWQYTGDGVGPLPHKIPGIPGASWTLDINSYSGTPDELAKEWAS